MFYFDTRVIEMIYPFPETEETASFICPYLSKQEAEALVMVAARIPNYMQGNGVNDSDYYVDEILEAAFYSQFE